MEGVVWACVLAILSVGPRFQRPAPSRRAGHGVRVLPGDIKDEFAVADDSRIRSISRPSIHPRNISSMIRCTLFCVRGFVHTWTRWPSPSRNTPSHLMRGRSPALGSTKAGELRKGRPPNLSRPRQREHFPSSAIRRRLRATRSAETPRASGTRSTTILQVCLSISVTCNASMRTPYIFNVQQR